MRGIILEGISGSGKTTLLRALTARWTGTRRGPLWIATEHLTERVLEPLATASPASALSHLDSHLHHLERLAAWDADAPRGSGTETVFVLERFHLSVGAHISGLAAHDWAPLEERLLGFGAILVWCRLPLDSIVDRAVRRTRAERQPAWTCWLTSLGKNEAEQTDHFRREQEQVAELVRRSRLPVIEFTFSETSFCSDLEMAVTAIERFLENSIPLHSSSTDIPSLETL
ncbi:MAG: hypothetical protein WA705_10415 [Candidatus Ozemobacteraceae bacterium]